ncbi:MAG: hypothetical protein QXR45_12135 [Candidatus Bathyarchaeia archaeon]
MAASKELNRSYGVVHRSSRRVIDAIRKVGLKRKLSGLIEIDEAYVKAGLLGSLYTFNKHR